MIIFTEISPPSPVSYAVAHSSTYGVPTSIVCGLAPIKVSVGGVISGAVIFMINVAHVEFPAISVTTNTYVPFPVINCQLVYETQLSVAVTHVLLSENVILTHPVYVVHEITHANVGDILSIQFTLPVAYHVFPAKS